MKNETGQWWLLNDSSATLTSFAEANTRDNYVLLLERKLRLQDAQENVESSSIASSRSPVMLTLHTESEKVKVSSQTTSIGEDLSLTPVLAPTINKTTVACSTPVLVHRDEQQEISSLNSSKNGLV